jgi:hypothetical protein
MIVRALDYLQYDFYGALGLSVHKASSFYFFSRKEGFDE